MVERKIRLKGVEDIKLLCNAAVKYNFDIDILSGNYIIDAKSFMGIFSLDQRESLSVRVNSDEADAAAFFQDIQRLCIS